MKVFIRGFAALLVASLATVGYSQDYTNETTFKNLLGANYFHEPFTGWQYGNPDGLSDVDGFASWADAGNGSYAFVASSSGDLWSLQNALSTDDSGASMVITFTNSTDPVFAFGGMFENVDESGANDGGTETVTFNGGHTFNVTGNTAPSFYGFISSTALTSVTITVSGGSASDQYAYLGDVYVGAPLSTPEPVSMGALAIGAVALIRRRRR